MGEPIQPQMGLNFEQVWAALMENRWQPKETALSTPWTARSAGG
jgi:hypothetical protein